MSGRSPRLWPGARPQTVELDLPSSLHLWLSVEGYPVAQRLDGDELVLMVSTSDSPDSADVPAGTRSTAQPTAELLVQVPAGYGLLIDGGTPGRRVVPGAELDAARSTAAPDGTEPDLRVTPVPAEHQAAAEAAARAGREAGVKAILTAWANGGGRSGLWVTLHRPSEAALDAVLDAVAATGLAAPARVLNIATLPGGAQSRLDHGLARAHDGAPARLLTGRQEVVVAVATLLGSLLLVLGRRADAVGTQVAGAVLIVLVLAGCLAARQRTAARLDGLALTGGAVLAGFLVWQAVRGLD